MTTVLSACFVVLFLVSAVCLIWSTLPVWIKTVLIVSTVLVCAALYTGVRYDRGLPSTADFSNPFLLAHTMVRSPDPAKRDPGAVFYVIVESFDGKAVPRVYSRNYTESEHRKASEAQGQLDAQGSPVWMKEHNGHAEESSSGNELAQQGRGLGELLRELSSALGIGTDRNNHSMVPQNTSPQDAKRPINTNPRGDTK